MMRPFAFVMLLMAAALAGACRGPKLVSITTPAGAKVQLAESGLLGGKDFSSVKVTPAGGVAIISRADLEKSFSDGATAGVSGLGVHEMGLSNRATTAADAAVAKGAQQTAVKEAGIAAGVETERIRADLTKAITLPK